VQEIAGGISVPIRQGNDRQPEGVDGFTTTMNFFQVDGLRDVAVRVQVVGRITSSSAWRVRITTGCAWSWSSPLIPWSTRGRLLRQVRSSRMMSGRGLAECCPWAQKLERLDAVLHPVQVL